MMLNEIKQITHNVIEGEKLSDLIYGTVKSVNPLEITLNQWITLGETLVDVPARLVPHDVQITIDGVTKTGRVNDGLKGGDTVAMLRKTGGQKFLIIDKVRWS